MQVAAVVQHGILLHNLPQVEQVAVDLVVSWQHHQELQGLPTLVVEAEEQQDIVRFQQQVQQVVQESLL
jgi:hypothetical protein